MNLPAGSIRRGDGSRLQTIWRICFHSRRYPAHRLAFLYMTGECLSKSIISMGIPSTTDGRILGQQPVRRTYTTGPVHPDSRALVFVSLQQCGKAILTKTEGVLASDTSRQLKKPMKLIWSQPKVCMVNSIALPSLATFGRKIREPEGWGRIGAVAIFCKPGRISVDGGARFRSLMEMIRERTHASKT